MKIYLVGGAVRDRLLGLEVKERDWVVVGSCEGEMLERGYLRADATFPVFLCPSSGEEYALARRETKTGPGYKGFRVDAAADVTLEEDLRRRDLTINAIAEDDQGRLVDPFDGCGDLRAGRLHHITPAFSEDPVRLLRAARFAATLGRWGFFIAQATHALLKEMAASGELETLMPQRLWREMRLALLADQPWRFFEVLDQCNALRPLLPALVEPLQQLPGRSLGDERAPLAALKRAAVLSADPAVRFAAVMFDAWRTHSGCLDRLPVEREPHDLLALGARLEDALRAPLEGDAGRVLAVLEQSRALQRPERLQALLQLLSAMRPEGARRAVALYSRALEAAAAVTARSLSGGGLRGAALGAELRRLRAAAVARVIGA
ncbi:MAG: multifunctional CCA tRNA nucleotidyl transferase/2'3'-cyclic phosphodiesterase/2'nucleotidase/phosphatase [Candidatus Sedimenticola endophacoides]